MLSSMCLQVCICEQAAGLRKMMLKPPHKLSRGRMGFLFSPGSLVVMDHKALCVFKVQSISLRKSHMYAISCIFAPSDKQYLSTQDSSRRELSHNYMCGCVRLVPCD